MPPIWYRASASVALGAGVDWDGALSSLALCRCCHGDPQGYLACQNRLAAEEETAPLDIHCHLERGGERVQLMTKSALAERRRRDGFDQNSLLPALEDGDT